MRVQVVKKEVLSNKLSTKKPIKYDKRKHDLGPNGVFMRKNRLSTVLTVNIQGEILEVIGINPTNLKIGSNVYD